MILLLFIWFDWQVIKTDNFTVFYKPGYTWEANEYLMNLEHYRQAAVEFTDNDLKPVRVVVEDLGTYSNGIADPFLGKIQVFTYPDNINQTMELQESWHRAVAYHELVHIMHLSRTSGFTKSLNSCFGSMFSPNMYAPRWLVEGIAVYAESQLSPYEGRLNDGYYDQYAHIRTKSFPGLIEISNEPLRFPADQSYLYGGQFTQYFIDIYGLKSLSDYLRVYGHYFWAPLTVILPAFGIDMAMRKSIGKDFPALYKQYRRTITDNIYEPDLHGYQITERGWYIGSMIARGNDIYYNRKSLFKAGPFDVFTSHRINKYDTRNAEEQITLKTNSLVTTPLRILDNKLYYTMREIKRGAANSYIQRFGYTSRLYCFDLLTNKKEFILEHDIRAFCLQSNGRLLFTCDRKHAFGSELWRGQILPEKIMETDFLIYELIANDKYLIAVAARPYENSDICLIDTVTGRIEPIMITPWNEGQLYFKNESTILYIANYQGQHDAYELNLIDRTVYRITNDFAHWPLIIDNQLYFTGLNEMGFDLYRLPYQPQPFAFPEKEIIVDRPVQTPVQTRPGNFWDLLATLEPAARVPVIYPVNEDLTSWQPGFFMFGADAMLENIYTALLTYNNFNNSLYYELNWRSNIFMPLSVNFNASPDLVKLFFSYPLHVQLRPGINYLGFLIDFRSFDDFNRKEFAPSIYMRFDQSPHYFFIQARLPYERQTWYSNIDRSAQQLIAGLKLRANTRSFYLLSYFYNDPDNPDMPRIPIRGYDELRSYQGLLIHNALDQKLFSIRHGLWNPNIYIEDLFGSVFFDAAIDQDQELYWSTGIELKAEIKAGFGYIKFIPIIGLSLNRNREIRVYFNIQPATENPY